MFIIVQTAEVKPADAGQPVVCVWRVQHRQVHWGDFPLALYRSQPFMKLNNLLSSLQLLQRSWSRASCMAWLPVPTSRSGARCRPTPRPSTTGWEMTTKCCWMGEQASYHARLKCCCLPCTRINHRGQPLRVNLPPALQGTKTELPIYIAYIRLCTLTYHSKLRADALSRTKYNVSEKHISSYEKIIYITIRNWDKSDEAHFSCFSRNSLGKADGRIQTYSESTRHLVRQYGCNCT